MGFDWLGALTALIIVGVQACIGGSIVAYMTDHIKLTIALILVLIVLIAVCGGLPEEVLGV